MAEFICPKCNSKNIKESASDLGCSCCGYGRTTSVSPPATSQVSVCTACHRPVNEAGCTTGGHILLG